MNRESHAASLQLEAYEEKNIGAGKQQDNKERHNHNSENTENPCSSTKEAITDTR